MPPFVCFYTLGTRYEAEAARLRKSLDALGLEHDLRGVDDRGSWKKNTAMTAGFIYDMLREYAPEPIVYIDADAVVWRRPVLLEALGPGAYDIAAHRAVAGHLNNGTLWLANTPVCRALIGDYKRRVEDVPGERDEQRHLDLAIKAMPAARVYYLPESYCFIHDLMKSPASDAVIEHLQASRESTGSTLLPSRQRRLAEIESQ